MDGALRARRLVIDIPQRADGSALDVAVEPGQLWAVLGPNGAGKTTLLHTLAGLRAPRRGAVELDGMPLERYRRREVARHVGVVFQDNPDTFPATVAETALMGRHPHRSPWDVDTAEDWAAVTEALARMELAEASRRLVSTLSGGERRRLAIATAWVQRPRIWLVDEPTNHLDLRHQVAVMELLAAEARAGRAVVACLHDVNIAARWCDHVLLLHPDGRAQSGPAASMLERRRLEALYRQRLVALSSHGTHVFVPAP